jgi:Fe-S-cluster containining protein
MEIQFSKSIGLTKLALMDTAARADNRRLRMYKDEIPCKPACSGCCSRLIEITMSEAVLIYEHLKKEGVWQEVKKIAKSQLPLIKDAKPLAWFKMNLKCPVLNLTTQLCQAYPVRPATCSIHFVKSDPVMCDPWGQKSGPFLPIDFSDLYLQFRKRTTEYTEGFGILSLELPIQVALLLAEKINTLSGLSEEQVVSLVFNEL